MPLATALLLVVLPLAAASRTCLHSNVVYVDDASESPPCCSSDEFNTLSRLVNRTTMGYSSDSLLDEILHPDLVHFKSLTVSSRPHFEPVQQIYAKVHLRRLYDVDQKAQQYTLLLDLHWTWRDCRLIFDESEPFPLDLHERSELYSQMWTPSVVFLEEAHSTERYDTEENVLIFGDGRVQMRQQLSRQLSCTFDFTKLPWDQQSCTVSVLMPGHTSDQVMLHWDPMDPIHVDELSNGAWLISGPDAWRSSMREFLYESTEPGPARSLSALGFGFTLTRKPEDIVSDYIIPTTVYWFCSYCGFWVDAAAAPARVTLALIPILTLNNKMGQLRSILPPINKSFRLGNFMLSVFALSTVHLLEFVIVHHSQHNAKAFLAAHKNDEENTPENAEAPEPKGVQRLLRRHQACWLRFALWARDRLDFHSRWFCPVAFLIIMLSTLL